MTTMQDDASRMGPEAPQAAASQVWPPPQASGAPAGPPPGWNGRWNGPAGRKSPGLAGFLSFLMPGLGQVYLGYYQRGFVHALVFASTVACLASGAARGIEPLFGIFLGFFYLFNIIDAVRRTTLYNQALAGMTQIPLPEDFKMPAGRPPVLAGVVLTGIGILLLANTRFDIDLDWMSDWWPLAIVLVGVYMLNKSWRERSARP